MSELAFVRPEYLFLSPSLPNFPSISSFPILPLPSPACPSLPLSTLPFFSYILPPLAYPSHLLSFASVPSLYSSFHSPSLSCCVVFAVVVFVRLSSTCQYCIKTTGQIELGFSMEVSFQLSYVILLGNFFAPPKTRVLRKFHHGKSIMLLCC